MSKISWLQISDIHLGYRSYTSLTARNLFFEYIQQEISKRDIRPGMLLLTGDYVYAPEIKGDWVDKALEHTQEILKATNILPRNVYLVPGNHDIYQRDDSTRVDVLEGVYRNYVSDIGEIETSRIKTLLSSFQYYNAFYTRLYESDPTVDEKRKQWHSEHIHVVFETDDVNIVLINTAIFYGKNYDSGSMILGTYHLEKVLNSIKNSKPIIAIGHHPFDSFRSDEAKRIKDILCNNSVSLYLCGHGHVINIEKHKNQINEIMAPTSMSRDERDKSPCQIGFLIGEYDTETSSGLIEAHSYDPFSNIWDKYRQIGGKMNKVLDDRIHGIYRF